MQQRNPRLSITLPEGLFQALERWATKVKDKPTSLATFVLRTAIEAAIADGTIPEAPLESEAASGELEGDRAIRSVLRKIALGEQPSPGEVAIASAELDVDPNELMRRSRKAKEGNGGAINC